MKLREYIDDTKDYINIQLDNHRNQLIQVCLSKGLGAPAGTVIVGSKDFITRAKTLRKTLGGGMRQVGVLCATALVAVQENVGMLESDHNNAKFLARKFFLLFNTLSYTYTGRPINSCVILADVSFLHFYKFGFQKD
ncbi:probable low-specificity L-threonine aldolase 1 isoform X2 [Camellia sinensis]|uniref:probable low-specificity L-threonine aldolase 1 isoform X2 n=1 Tax=Camellia sinensis TaxID=4442 RepID=UPI001036220A|nr:probable low-specificity L-threonine aldolase 1 isoform X2 [Camellia sinensis]